MVHSCFISRDKTIIYIYFFFLLPLHPLISRLLPSPLYSTRSFFPVVFRAGSFPAAFYRDNCSIYRYRKFLRPKITGGEHRWLSTLPVPSTRGMHGPTVGLTGPPGNRFDYLFHGELGIDPKITLSFLFLSLFFRIFCVENRLNGELMYFSFSLSFLFSFVEWKRISVSISRVRNFGRRNWPSPNISPTGNQLKRNVWKIHRVIAV